MCLSIGIGGWRVYPNIVVVVATPKHFSWRSRVQKVLTLQPHLQLMYWLAVCDQVLNGKLNAIETENNGRMEQEKREANSTYMWEFPKSPPSRGQTYWSLNWLFEFENISFTFIFLKPSSSVCVWYWCVRPSLDENQSENFIKWNDMETQRPRTTLTCPMLRLGDGLNWVWYITC